MFLTLSVFELLGTASQLGLFGFFYRSVLGQTKFQSFSLRKSLLVCSLEQLKCLKGVTLDMYFEITRDWNVKTPVFQLVNYSSFTEGGFCTNFSPELTKFNVCLTFAVLLMFTFSSWIYFYLIELERHSNFPAELKSFIKYWFLVSLKTVVPFEELSSLTHIPLTIYFMLIFSCLNASNFCNFCKLHEEPFHRS